MACEKEGPQGVPGTANVIYSDWIPVDWDLENDQGSLMQIDEARITEEFMETGLVLLFIRFNDGGSGFVYAVPFSNPSTSSYFVVVNSEIRLVVQTMDGSNLSNNYLFNHLTHVRYVLIPGGVNASTALDGIDLKDLDAVMGALKIPGE